MLQNDCYDSYLVLEPVPELLLPGVLLVPLEPIPLLLGEVVVLLPLLPMPLVLGEVVLGEVVLPLVAPPLLVDELSLLPLEEPDLLKYASHSERDTWPSLFVSTVEKLGARLLDAPLEALPPLDMPEDPDELVDGVADVSELLLPEAPVDGVAEVSELLLPEAPVDGELELCAIATLAIAKSAAAVAVPTSLNMWMFLHHKD